MAIATAVQQGNWDAFDLNGFVPRCVVCLVGDCCRLWGPLGIFQPRPPLIFTDFGQQMGSLAAAVMASMTLRPYIETVHGLDVGLRTIF